MLFYIFLGFLFFILVFWRRIAPWLLLFFVNKLAKRMEKKMNEQTPPDYTSTSSNKTKPNSHNTGEYIDYEEIE